MFRVKKRVGKRDYYQLVENYRENGRHRQRVLVHLGPEETVAGALERERAKLEKLEGERLLEKADNARRQAHYYEVDLKGTYRDGLATYHGGEVPSYNAVRTMGGKQRPWVRSMEPVELPEHADEYRRAFSRGVVERDAADYEGLMLFYKGYQEYEAGVRNRDFWLGYAENKVNEYNGRRARILEKIAKLEEYESSGY